MYKPLIQDIHDLSPYTVEGVRVKNVLIRQVNNLVKSRLDEFTRLVSQFIRKSKEDDATVALVLDKINYLIRHKKQNMGLWVVEYENRLEGYFFMEVDFSKYGRLHAIVHHMYLSPRLRIVRLFPEMDRIMTKWARDRGAREIVFLTERNPMAFYRILPPKWKPYAVVFKREV